ncbi:hypothetical protein [Flavobacterium sp. 245]|uniref:hypothetical protein n=1 Tax=Flavobacterium sp. 245 TaxID=2512115 RepID=UPI00105CF624|nr:hypothetical protein [Flavobacterium sp. 245]TDO94940.1 hypothetical protein EV145_11526 [Flavobacterium sp. 245]
MGKLKVSQLKNLRTVLLKKDLIEMLETHLAEHDINDIEIRSIQFKRKDAVSNNMSVRFEGCPDGHELRLSCSDNGSCVYKCMPIYE